MRYQKQNNKKARLSGFTLIELLVVVLIIGILAAVALPQYERAVEKARFAEGISLLRSIGQANDAYYLANGVYAYNIDDLDIKVGQRVGPETPNHSYYETKWFWVAASWNPAESNPALRSIATANRQPMWHGYRLSLYQDGRIICISQDASMSEKERKMAEFICSSFGKKIGEGRYQIN